MARVWVEGRVSFGMQVAIFRLQPCISLGRSQIPIITEVGVRQVLEVQPNVLDYWTEIYR